jgi:hypothetical protein
VRETLAYTRTRSQKLLPLLELWISALAPGIAGIDPAGALIAIGALAAGARKRAVMGSALVSILGTAGLGTTCR